MYLLNLTLGQVLLVFGAISAMTVALYLLDRSRRRQVVSTLRFWIAAEQPPAARRRKRIQQPWSLLLQLLSILLLLLAIGELRWGVRAGTPRDHIVLLDTSAWTAARAPGERRSLLDMAKERARGYVRAVPARDRVMLVRADALATPATAFEFDRKKVLQAIAASEPGASAMNMDQAMAFARNLQEQGGRKAGEVVYIGPGRIAERDAQAMAAAPVNLRVIAIADRADNCGIRKMGAQRSPSDPDVWQIHVGVRNYAAEPRSVNLILGFGGALVGQQRLSLPPVGDREANFVYRTKSAGVVEARITPGDEFPPDDRAALELPAAPRVRITVYSDEPELLRPVLTSNPAFQAVFLPTAQYQAEGQGIVVLDRFKPPRKPAGDAIWIDPPADGSPVPVRARVSGVTLTQWAAGHALGAGLRSKDFKIDSTSEFAPAAGDIRLAEAGSGTVIVARDGKPKTVVLGFHPARSAMRYELATPLLFANIIHWMEPQLFRQSEIVASSVGSVTASFDGPREALKVVHEDGSQLPFTVHDNSVSFFSGRPGTVKVESGNRETVYSLTLPALWESKWTEPGGARHGVPPPSPAGPGSVDLWKWLAVAGAAGLLAEWFLYGRFRRGVMHKLQLPFSLGKAS